MAGIEIDDLMVGYGDTPVIAHLSLAIPDGSLFTLLGPSGCGKTTLLRTIAGFLPVRSGRLMFGGRDVADLPPWRRDIGMVFQDYALFPDKSVFDNVAYGLRARRQDETTIRKTVGQHLERVGLSAFAARMPADLSGGQRQRVALARALAIRPSVLLMDEPLSNLDAKLRLQVRETIADLQREFSVTTVFVTHDQEEALALSDRIGLMRAGKLEQVGAPEEIYARPVSGYAADFVGGANVLPASTAAPAEAGRPASAMLAGRPIDGVAVAPLAAGPVLVIARPENLKLAEEDAGAPNALPCRLRRRQFLGARTLWQVALADGALVSVEEHGPPAGREIGSEATLVFDPAATLVAPP